MLVFRLSEFGNLSTLDSSKRHELGITKNNSETIFSLMHFLVCKTQNLFLRTDTFIEKKTRRFYANVRTIVCLLRPFHIHIQFNSKVL